MKNIWLKKRQTYQMPVTLNEDQEVEFDQVKESQIPELIEFWNWHYKNGSLSRNEYVAVAAIITYCYEKQSGEIIE